MRREKREWAWASSPFLGCRVAFVWSVGGRLKQENEHQEPTKTWGGVFEVKVDQKGGTEGSKGMRVTVSLMPSLSHSLHQPRRGLCNPRWTKMAYPSPSNDALPPGLKNLEEVGGRYVYYTNGKQAMVLGQGTYGTVYLGKDTTTDTPVAVKVTTTNEIHLFKHIDNELKISKDLNHPNLVRCLATEVRNRPFFLDLPDFRHLGLCHLSPTLILPP